MKMNTAQPDRTIAPAAVDIDEVVIQLPEKCRLSNGWNCYRYFSDTSQIVRLDLIVPINTSDVSCRLQPHFAARLITEGTASYSSEEIASIIDFCGAVVDANADKHHTVISLHALRRHLPTMLPLLRTLFTEANFPEKEFGIMRDNMRQEFIVNSERMSHLVRRHFPSLIFGATHPYGQIAAVEDYDKLETIGIQSFYTNNWLRNQTQMVLAGNFQAEDLELIDQVFANDFPANIEVESHWPNPSGSDQRELLIQKPDAMQSAIRIGCRSINRTHEDYPGMVVLNTILGGYFGSRLMTKIREEKGLTYGIGSGLALFPRDAMFLIQAEVMADKTRMAIDEIFKEVLRLSNELVPMEELSLVKNYILGQMLRGFDGVFNLSDRFKALLPYGVSMDVFYKDYVKGINATCPESLRLLAQKYLVPEKMYTAVAGRME